MPKSVRPPINNDSFETSFKIARTRLQKAVEKHGSGGFVSWHEILGKMNEEHHELLVEVQKETPERIDELVDIVVAGIWGVASSLAGCLIDEQSSDKQDSSIKWEWVENDKTWYGYFPVLVNGVNGTWTIWLIKRPNYCDRGRWIVGVQGIMCSPPDREEEFPRYFFDLDTAKSEMDQWVKMRQEIIKDKT